MPLSITLFPTTQQGVITQAITAGGVAQSVTCSPNVASSGYAPTMPRLTIDTGANQEVVTCSVVTGVPGKFSAIFTKNHAINTPYFSAAGVDVAPYGICEGPDGNVWYTESASGNVTKITPAGVITEFVTPAALGSGNVINGPLGMCVGPDGNFWICDNANSKILKMTPAGVCTEYATLTPNAGPYNICSGPDGNLWFTEANVCKVAKITTAGVVTEYTPAHGGFFVQQMGICAGPDGNVWFTEYEQQQVAKITPAGVITEYAVTGFVDPNEICLGPDGNLWYTQASGSTVSRITPAGVITNFATPTPFAQPEGICLGADGNLWFTEVGTTPPNVCSCTPAGVITEYSSTLTGGSGIQDICAGPSNTIWFTDQFNTIGKFSVTPPTPPPPPVVSAPPSPFRFIIYDKTGKIVAVPQDVLSFGFEDIVNGGSGQGTFMVQRHFVDQGWLDYDYRVQLYINEGLTPWYDGRIIEFDPAQYSGTTDSENITVHTEGWHTQLAHAIVSEILTPSLVNGTMAADTYLAHLIGLYVDNTKFGTSYIAALPVTLDGFTFDGQELNRCIDDIVKQVLDNTGNLMEWWVRGLKGALPCIYIQPQRNPNLISTPTYFAPGFTTPTKFMVEFKDETIYEYSIQNSSANLYNMIALYGGLINNVQVYGAFKDSTSISLYGVRQKKVTNTTLLTQATLASYAASYILQNGYPQPQGSFKKYIVDDLARAGQFFQIMERGVNAAGVERFLDESTTDLVTTTPQGVKQVRAIKVVTSMQAGRSRLEQQVFTSAPRPFIDHAFYGSINVSANVLATRNSRQGPTQLTTYYVVSGGDNGQVGGPSSQLIVASDFLQGSYYDTSGRALPPYSTIWSFTYMDGINFYLDMNGGHGELTVVNGFGHDCKALSAPIPVTQLGTYTLSYGLSWPTSTGDGPPRWDIVVDRGPGVPASAYTGADVLYSVVGNVGAAHTETGTYVNSDPTIKSIRVLFESNGTSHMSTSLPVLSFV